MAQSYKSKVLNLWSQDESKNFRVVPGDNDVSISYDAGILPVEFPHLSTQGVNVHAKMFLNAQEISDESSRALNAESELQDNIDAENERASNAEAAIQSELTAEKARVSQQEIFEAGELAAEISRAQAAESVLTANLQAEITTRTANDNQFQTDLNTELLRAQGEEQRIEGVLNAYVSSNDLKVDANHVTFQNYQTSADARMDGIDTTATNNYNALYGMITSNSGNQTSESARLDARIDNVISNTDPASLDSLSEIVNKFNADGQTYADRLTALEGVVNALVEQLGN